MATFHSANDTINISSLLTNSIASGTATPTIGVSTGTGALFAAASATKALYVTIALAAETETGVSSVVEVFEVAAGSVVGDNIPTIARGISNTSPQNWSIGDKVQIRVVDFQWKEIQDAITSIETGAILTNASIGATAAIVTTKLADGANFIQRGGAVAMTANLNFNSNKGINVANPTAAQDAMTLGYANTNYLNVNGTVTMTGNLNVNSNKVINVATAVATTDVANLAVVQTYAYERTYKDACDWSATGNVALTGLGVQANGEWTGAITANDRIFLSAQTSPIENGIYAPAAGAWARSADADSDLEWSNGLIVSVRQGATRGGTSWKCTNATVTLGVTNIAFSTLSTASIDIGTPIPTGTNGYVLYVASNALAQSSALFFNDASKVLTVTGITATPIVSALNTAVTNTVSSALSLSHATSGTAAAGYGVSIDMGLEDSAGTLVPTAGVIGTKWTVATAGAMVSNITFTTLLSAVPLVRMIIEGNGSVAMQATGATLKVKEGANACMGTATLAAGTIVVSTTAVTASSRIFFTRKEGGSPANFGHIYISARTASTSFTITSTNGADAGEVVWIIIEPS